MEARFCNLTYEKIQKLMTGRCKNSRKIGNNTWIDRVKTDGDDEFHVVLHWTSIVVFRSDGSMTFNSGGWRTATTKARMNEVQDRVYVSQLDFVWYLGVRGEKGWSDSKSMLFEDGSRVTKDGDVVAA